MKQRNLLTKITSSAMLFLLLIPSHSFANGKTILELRLTLPNLTALNQRLKGLAIASAKKTQSYVPPYTLDSAAQRALSGLPMEHKGYRPPATQEGLATSFLNLPEEYLTADSMLASMNEILSEADPLGAKQRMLFLYDAAFPLVKESGQARAEEFSRIKLNRCVDVFNRAFPIAGAYNSNVPYQSAGVWQVFEIMWNECYNEATAYLNNALPVYHVEHNPNHPQVIKQYLSEFNSRHDGAHKIISSGTKMSALKMGHRSAAFFFGYTVGNISVSAKMHILVATLAYMGEDAWLDTRRIRPPMKKLLRRISRVMHNRNMYNSSNTGILQLLRDGYEPGPAQEGWLRAEVNDLIGEMNTAISALNR